MLLCFFFLSLSVLQAQTEGLRKGQLPNGLTYYIYNDGSTPGEAQYYLYQNVGAVLENDDEAGLAHILEHLAFNTTDNFADGIMTFLRRHGLNDFEAFTGIDDTRYAVHNVPTNDEELNRKMLLVLRDWCHGIKILPKDVEKERGIVLEEWRHRAGIDRRLTDAIAPVVYNHSIYSRRNVIGSQEFLQTFKAGAVKAFYDKWYRPNMQFIAIIGDVDLDKTEKNIAALFKSLPNKKAPETSPSHRTIADNAQPLYMRFIDKENKSASFGLYQRFSVKGDAPEEERIRQFIFTRFFNSLISKRFAMLKNADKETFIAAQASLSPLVRNYYQMAWDVVPYKGKDIEALRQMLAVRDNLRENGFSKDEFNAEKEKMYKGMKEVLEAKGLGMPDNVMELLKQNFLFGIPVTDFRSQIQRNLETLVELEAEDANAWLRAGLDNRNLAFVTYSKSQQEMNISESNFMAALKDGYKQADAGMTSSNPITSLIDFKIVPGKITAEKQLKTLNAKEWTLANGAKVIYKYLPEAKQQIFFAGSSEGGRSVVAPENIADYTAMRSLLMQSGVHNYNRNQLAQWLQGKDLDLSLSLEDYSDGIGGNASTDNMDDFFAYMYLVLSRQNFSKSVFDKYVQRSKYLYENRASTGMDAIQDSIRQLLFPASQANPLQNDAFFNSMRYEGLTQQFNEHFGNAGRFTFCLVGDVDEAKAKELVTRYIGSLNGQANTARLKAKPIDFASTEKVIKRTFETDIEGDMTEIEISYANHVELTDKEQAAFEVTRAILERRYFDILREKEHLTYTVGVQTSYSARPTVSDNINIHLSTSRDNADKVVAYVYAILNDIKAGRFSSDEFKAAMIPLAVDEETPQESLRQDNPSLWMGLLNIYAETGQQLTAEESAAVEPIFKTLVPADIAAVAQKVIDTAKLREIIVKPKTSNGKRTFE